MKQVFFTFCNLVPECDELLMQIERFFSSKGWNLLVPENALNVQINHPLKINYSSIDKSDLVIVDLSSKRMEVVKAHEHAVNKGIEILYIRKEGEDVLEDLKQYEKAAFAYERPIQVHEWLDELEID